MEKIRRRVTWPEILLRGLRNPPKRPWYLSKVKAEKALDIEDGAERLTKQGREDREQSHSS